MATPLNVALDERAALKSEALSILDAATGARTAQQTQRLQAIEARMQTIDADIERLRKASSAEKAEAAAVVSDLTGLRPTGRRFTEMFGATTLSNDGWSNADEFLSVLHNGLSDGRLRSAVATGGIGADGGFSVPTQYAAQWLDASLESEIVRPRATVWPMTSSQRRVPGWDASDSSSVLFGAFSGQWVAEGEEINVEIPKMRAMLLIANKLGILTQSSNELLADGLGYDSQLSSAIVRALGWFLDSAFLTGDGVAKPLGVINAPCTITVSKESGQTAATINYTNLTKMFARMAPASVPNSVWVANSTTIPQLAALTVTIGTGGSHIPVMTESNGRFTILTRPVIFTEKVPALGTVGDIGLYDFSQYAIGMRKEISLDRSQHAGFTRDTAYFRGLLRADGAPTWAKAYTPKNGDTLSPFVILETRS